MTVTVTRASAIVWQSSGTSKRGKVTCVAPFDAAARVMGKSARWNMGATCSITSEPATGHQSCACSMFASKFACVSITPLARPVVPLV